MTEISLLKHLQELQRQLNEDLERVATERQRLSERIKETGNEIEHLRALLRELMTKRQDLKYATDKAEKVHRQSQRKAALDALESSFKQLQQTLDYWRAMAHSLQRRKKIQDAIPDLVDLLADFRAFDPQSEAVTRLPKTFRNTLLAEHQRLARKLDPYFELEAQEAELSMTQPLTLCVVGVHNEAEEEFLWVLPYRTASELSDQDSNVLNDVVWVVANQILNLNQGNDWVFDDVSVDSWEGYDALVTRGVYTGKKPIAQVAQAYLQEQLSTRPFFQHAVPDIEVAVLSSAIVESLDELVPSQVIDISEKEPEQRLLAERTDGWYDEDDIISWEAPLKVVEGSLWNKQARRLRTLLMRMIAKGYVETREVPLVNLTRNLPSPHGDYLIQGLESLCEAGVLHRRESTKGNAVALNPDYLQEVQDLINREITPVWAGIIVSDSAPSQN